MFVPRSQTYRAAYPFRSFSGPFFYPEGEGGGDNPPADPPEKKDPPADPLAGLTDEQVKALNSRIAAARKDGEKDGRTKAEALLAEAKKKADEDAERDRQVKAGEYEKVIDGLKGSLTSVSGEKDTLTQENTALKEQLAAYQERDRKQIDDGIAAIKADWPDVLAAFAPLDPGPDAPINARMTWFETMRAEKARREEGAKERFRSPVTPQPNGRERGGVDKELQALRTSGRYGI